MSGQVIGHGTTFALETSVGPPAVYESILGVNGVDFGSNKVDTVDNTDMTTSGNQRTYIGGLENSGDITAKFNVKPGDATQAALRAAKDSTVHGFQVTYPGAVRTRTFSGIITSIDESIPDDKLPTFTVKIQITGPITDS